MDDTSLSLLDRLGQPDDGEAWQRLVEIYSPLLRGWLTRYEVQSADADDLMQDVLFVVMRSPQAIPLPCYTSVTQPDPDGTGPLATPVTSYTYDPLNRLSNIADPLGGSTSFTYDTASSQPRTN